MIEKRRIDQLLVERGVFESRARAQAAIKAELVRIDGAVARKASDVARADAAIEADQPWPYVSRGGVKLAHGLDAFGVDPAGRVCLDVGSSTGGFTEALLSRGAATVVAIDTGRDQMHAKLRDDPRIMLFEGVDARSFDASHMPERASLIVVDVSFISLTLIAPALAAFAAPQAELIALIKPQFEVGRAQIGKKGIVSDETARRGAVDRVSAAMRIAGWAVLTTIDSAIAGGDGNIEYLLHARRGA